MSRQDAIARAAAYFDSGAFRTDLARRVAMPTESQGGARRDVLRAYLDRRDRAGAGAARICDAHRRQPGGRTRAVPHRRAARRRRTADRAHLRPRRRGRRLRRRNGAPASIPGRSSSRATAGTAAAPPTTRASTRSTSPRSSRCWRRARPARLQLQAADRDGRGGRLAGPARARRRTSATRSPPTC